MSKNIPSPTVTRRNLVKVAGATAAATALGATGTALADAAAEGMVPGTYSATAPGYMGENTVFVTVDETSIVDVAVRTTDKPQYLTQFPVELMPQRILEAQSCGVDVVAGATFTSFSIKAAAEDCLRQAGAPESFFAAPEKTEKPEGEPLDVDVLVIGSGLGGFMAAASAAQNNFDLTRNELSVTLIEKLDFVGGSMPLAIGGLFTASPLSAPPKQSFIDSEIERLSLMNELPVNEPLIARLYNTAGDTTLRMQQFGLPLQSAGIDGEGIDDVDRNFSGDPYVFYPIGAGDAFWGGGRHLIDVFTLQFRDNLGVDVRTSTSATGLLMEDGAVVGARVEGPDSVYDIHAKKVILACGGMTQNHEMIEQFAPHDVDSIPWSNGGTDGDGLRMGMEAGGRLIGDRLWGHVAIDNIEGIHNDLAYVMNAGLMVNRDGAQFTQVPGDNSICYALVAEQPDKVAWSVVDANNTFAGALEAALPGHYGAYIERADTIAELAEACGIDADGLAASVEEYNAWLAEGGNLAGDGTWRLVEGAAEGGKVPVVEGVAFPMMSPIEQGPFYALRVVQLHLGSCVGLAVDEFCRVLNDADEPVPNLYAIGECCIGGNVVQYHAGGWGLGGTCHTGRIAGEHAKEAILG